MVSSIQGMGQLLSVGMQSKSEGLTDDQKAQIQSILSQYDPDNVSAEDAKAIFQAFKDAGIKPARGMKEVIEVAGFDAEDLRAKGMPDDRPPAPPQRTSSTGINTAVLQELQDLLSQYDLTNLSDEDGQSLMTKLQEKGFIYPGSVLDLKS
jgi:hypothetical protein